MKRVLKMSNGKTIRQIADEIGVTRQAVYQKIKSNKSTVKRLQLYTFTVDSTKYYTSDGEKLIKSLFSDKQAVNEGVNMSTNSVYTPVNDFTPCKQEKVTINSTSSDDTVNKAVNEGVNVSTDSVYTPVNDFTPRKQEKVPINSAFSDDTVNTPVNEGVNKFTVNLTDLFTAQLTEKDRQITEKDKQLAEKDKQIAEKDKQLAEKDIQIANLTTMLQNAQEQQAALVQTLAAEQALAAADKKHLLLQAGATEQPENPNPPENVKKGFFRKIFGK